MKTIEQQYRQRIFISKNKFFFFFFSVFLRIVLPLAGGCFARLLSTRRDISWGGRALTRRSLSWGGRALTRRGFSWGARALTRRGFYILLNYMTENYLSDYHHRCRGILTVLLGLRLLFVLVYFFEIVIFTYPLFIDQVFLGLSLYI